MVHRRTIKSREQNIISTLSYSDGWINGWMNGDRREDDDEDDDDQTIGGGSHRGGKLLRQYHFPRGRMRERQKQRDS